MTVTHWTYDYFVPASPAAVYAVLANPHTYLRLSPLISEVSDIVQETDAAGSVVYRYRAVEQLRFFRVLRIPNPIRVEMCLSRPGEEVISSVSAAFNTHLTFVFRLQAEASGTRMTESIEAHLPALMRRYAVAEAKKVQQSRANTLPRLVNER